MTGIERRFPVKKKCPVVQLLKNLDLLIAAVALVALIAITFVGVIMRYGFNSPFAWQEEVQLMLIVWVTFLGGRYAFVTGSHCAIDVVVDALPKKIQRYVDLLIMAAVVVVLCYTGWQSFKYIQQMYNTGRVTNLLHIPYALIYAPVTIGCVTMAIQFAILSIKGFLHGEKSEKEAL